MASSPRIQGAAATGGRQLLASVLLAGCCMPSFAAGDLCHFEADGLVVTARDSTAEGGLGVEIEVADGPLVLTRLAIPADDGAAGCWQADLDGDRHFEIVVGLVRNGGTQPLRVVRYEWTGSLLEALPMAVLENSEGERYAGHEKMEVSSNLLLRSFDVEREGSASLENRHFRYETEGDGWVRLRALKRTPADDDTKTR